MLTYRALATGVIDVLPVPEGIQGKGPTGKPDSGLPRGPGRYRDGRLGLLENQGGRVRLSPRERPGGGEVGSLQLHGAESVLGDPDQGKPGRAFEAWGAHGATEDQQPAGSRQGRAPCLPTRQGRRPATVLWRHGRVSGL